MANKFKAGDLVQHKDMAEMKGVFVEYRTERGYQFGYFRKDNGQISGGWFDRSLVLQPNLTPAQKLGYKVGDKFITQRECTFKKGSIVTLFRDDKSSSPCFAGRAEDTSFTCADGQPGAFTSLDNVVPYVEPVAAKPQFKVGDRVKVIKAGGGFERSNFRKTGVIRIIDSTSLPVLVDFNDGTGSDWGKFEELELVVSSVIDIDAINRKLKQIDALSAEIKGLLG